MVDRDMEDRLVRILRNENLLRARAPRRWMPVAIGLAAAAALVLIGGAAGASHARRNTLEALLERTDLPLNDRILLMQRAGTAYIRAAHAYSEAAKTVDPVAHEVATRVLSGAASALPRSEKPQLIRY